jgi:hypothetical protein
MTNLTPGPDLDRRVAEAVGWERHKRGGMEWFTSPCGAHRRPSKWGADAIAALEATGLDWDIVRKGSRYDVSIEWEEATQWANGYGETIPLAICAAILAWKEGQR